MTERDCSNGRSQLISLIAGEHFEGKVRPGVRPVIQPNGGLKLAIFAIELICRANVLAATTILVQSIRILSAAYFLGTRANQAEVPEVTGVIPTNDTD